MEGSDFSGSHSGAAPFRWAPPRRMAVIGGHGEMGRLFSRFFEDAGYEIQVVEKDTWPTRDKVLRTADIVLFAVPLHETVTIIRESICSTRPDQLVMDLSSLKASPVREMMASSASVVGLHPMFGGRINSFWGQTLVACPARIDPRDWQGLRRLFTARGIRVKECTPEEHDRMMSIIQVLFHMTTMLIGRVLRGLGVDIAETLQYTSPSYRLEINLLGRIFAQNGALYSAITQMNPYTKEILEHLRESLEHYDRWYDEEDLEAFVQDFHKSALHLGDFCRQAYRESSTILDFSVRMNNACQEGE